MTKTHILILVILIILLILLPSKKTDADIPPVVIEVPQPVVPHITRYKPRTAQQIQVMDMVATEFIDASIMVDIANAESGFDPTQKNPNSTAKGVFQILDSTWKNNGCQGNVFVAENNIACARILYRKNGTTDWNASRHVWGRYVTFKKEQ